VPHEFDFIAVDTAVADRVRVLASL